MSHFVDSHVGRKIRQRRWLLGLTQQQLGERLGVRFQQVQKYETGANRVSASRLWEIASHMGVPVSYFYEGLTHEESGSFPEAQGIPPSLEADRDAMELLRHYLCSEPEHRRRLLELSRVLSGLNVA